MRERHAMRMVTYNIHRCVGSRGEADPERIARVLREIDGDIIALQEVVSSSGDGGGMLGYLAAQTGMYPVPGLTMLEGEGHYGNGLLCREKPETIERFDIGCVGREPRGIVKIVSRYGNSRLVVFATHLGLGRLERRHQVDLLLKYIGKGGREYACVVLGDFNEWYNQGRNMRLLTQEFGPVSSIPTFPARFPLLSLDRIWVRPLAVMKKIRVHKTALSRIASDHLPLVAELEVQVLSSGV